jgi:hypothetical protein
LNEALGMNSGIALRLRLHADGNVRAEVLQSRPIGFARVFHGMTPDELTARLPLIFSVCRQAQGAACMAALTGARGDDPAATKMQRHSLRVTAETLFEAVRVLSLTWPGVFGIRPASFIAEVNSAYIALQAGLSNGDDETAGPMIEKFARACRRVIFDKVAKPPQDMAGLEDWAHGSTTAAAEFFAAVLSRNWGGCGQARLDFLETANLPPLLDRLSGPDGEAFAGRPELGGMPVETGAFARYRHHRLVESALSAFGQGLMARLAARLAEAESLIDGFLGEAPATAQGREPLQVLATADGWGAGIVQSARGMLIHTLRLEGGKVSDFRILAPTEWNFHPGGAVVRALESLGGQEAFRRAGNPLQLAYLIAGSYDPCVPFEIALEQAEKSHA